MQKSRKREFRAAWIQCVNGQFQGLSKAEMQRTLVYQLDELQKDGLNAIIFQVRAECDALYESPLEPWSRFLSGQQGMAPQERWDPLQWMIEQCHKRNMELHAWINPYRAKTKGTVELASSHVAVKHPERVFSYDGQMILNPALEENRQYICSVVRDILERYDVDGLHIDDYFYPYPVKGLPIPDEKDYKAQPKGFKTIGDWRRDNVNVFMKEISETVHKVKPWVKFGVSPFGIYRNESADRVTGSRTNGLQNYDDLYADVLMWVNNGWADYLAPQLYWEIGNRAADYETLIRWWSKHASMRPLYIGEDVERTAKFPDKSNPKANQMQAKRRLHDELPGVQGTVLWYAKTAVDNVGNYGTALRNVYWRTPALQPLMPFIDGKAPKKVKALKAIDIDGDRVLFWQAPKGKTWQDKATKYAIYCYRKGEKVDISNGQSLFAITQEEFFKLPKDDEAGTVYAVTALDRMSNESKPKSVRIRK